MFLEHFKQHLESLFSQIKTNNENSDSLKHRTNQIRLDLSQRMELRNNYYHRKFPLLLVELCSITANKKHLQLIEKQHDHSKRIYQKIFNIQSVIDIDQYHQQYEQSKSCLDQLKTIVQQHENDLQGYKEELVEQNEQISDYSTKLFQIQFDQNQIRSTIHQLNQQILLEKQISPLIKYTFKSPEESIFPRDLEKQLHTEYVHLCTQINRIQFNIEQQAIDLLPLQFELYIYHTILNVTDIHSIEFKDQPLLLPRHTEQIRPQSAVIINPVKETPIQSTVKQLPMEAKFEKAKIKLTTFLSLNMPKIQFATTSRSYSVDVTTATSEQSLGPNLQSRLEALEAAMGVRLNLAKRQGRHSLSNTSPSPMQLSPTNNSLSTTTRHNIPTRSGQGVQRSASSCDAENRPGPNKRLKPSVPNENTSPSSSSTAAAIATIKKYPPPVRRPLITTTPIKQRTSPMDTSSPRLSRSSIASSTSSSNSSNYRTPIGSISPKPTTSPLPPVTKTRKSRLSMFGEQFSADILKTNLLWIDLKELDDENRAEVILQFGSIENFLREQNLFSLKQQQQFQLAAKNKTMVNRSRYQFLTPKKDRLELL